MTSIVLTALPPTSSLPALPVGPVSAVAPVAFAVVQAELPLPSAAPTPSQQAAPVATNDNADGAAMRPDQIFMSRQLTYPRADAATLAAGWRSMVRQYGGTLVDREMRARGGMLPPALLVTAQEGRLMRTPEPSHNADPWRFTIHAGSAQAQELRVVGRAGEAPPGRRRRARVGLRLELTLQDGTRVAIQIEPMPGGLALDLAAPGEDALDRLRTLQPAVDAAIARCGLKIVRRTYSQTLTPAMSAHASLAALDATSVLTLPVFRAIAELALLLPTCQADPFHNPLALAALPARPGF